MSKKGSTTIWDYEAVETLRRLYPNTPALDIAIKIGCSDVSVHKKARELGIKRDPDYDRYSFGGQYTKRKRRL